MPFWTVYQYVEEHPTGEKEIVHKGEWYAWTRDVTKTRVIDRPDIGVGRIVVFEADTATQVRQKMVELGMSRKKWSEPREDQEGENTPRYMGGPVVKGSVISEEGQSLYIHYKDGSFYRLNGLHRRVIQDYWELSREGK